jgi:glycosyltransferase involved in cell wall biosynthesis
VRELLFQWVKTNRVILLNTSSLIGTTTVTSVLGFAYWWTSLVDRCQRSNQPKIAYLLNSFPVLSETFIQQEILILEHQGLPLRLFSLFEPSASKTAKGVWNGQTPVTYISHQPRLKLLAIAVRCFLKTPVRFLRTGILTLTVNHYDLRLAIGCLLYASYIAEQIKHQGFTHLHAHFATESTSVAQTVYLLTGIPYSFTAHAYDIYLSRRSALANKMSMARFVVTCSAYNQQYLKKLVDQGIGERIHCIYLGLNLDVFPPNANVAPAPETVPLILAVGRLVEKKGLLYLVSACRILEDQGYDFICRIVGDGPQRQVLEQKVHELALTERVELLGAATHKQVIEMYQQATIVTLPCIIDKQGDRDGLPIALVEALYMGVPVVSTQVSGVPELISEEVNGLLVPPQDSTALAAALARLLDDPLLRGHLARAGRKTVLERFDMAQNVQHLISLFYADLEDRYDT